MYHSTVYTYILFNTKKILEAGTQEQNFVLNSNKQEAVPTGGRDSL
jgi:hypothetical protein